MIDQNYINWYFANEWHGRTENYLYSGPALINKVNDDEWVLDVGCGRNPYKGKIKNVVGVDPAFDEADHKCGIMDYEPDRLFDVAFCLGSVNFGTKADVDQWIAKVVSCLKPTGRIYWRCNPGVHDHGRESFEKIKVFPWTWEDQREMAAKYGFVIKNAAMDTNGKAGHVRLYAEWHRA